MKVLIVDDEPLARERLARMLGRLLPDSSVAQAATGEAALAIAREHNPDLILLDIRMSGKDGLQVAAELSESESPPAIIFCTAYDRYALEALKLQTVAYLLKPVREQELAQCLADAGKVNKLQLASLYEHTNRDEHSGTIVSSSAYQFSSTPFAEVRCFIAARKHVTAITPEREFVVSETLKELEQAYPDQLVRVHRNALVAIKHVQELLKTSNGTWSAILAGVESQPAISRRHLQTVKARLKAAAK